MKKRLSLILMLGMVAAALTTACLADDVIVPDWRGAAGTTFQQWNFDNGTNPASPEVVSNPYGEATAAISVGDFGEGWKPELPGFGSKTGFWDLGAGGTITLNIANNPVPNPYEIWLQITYFVDISQAPAVDIQGATRLGGETRRVESVGAGAAWWVDQSIWRIESGPSSETIVFTSDLDWGSVVDQVVVDTRSVVPEPASLTVLLAGLGGILLRRRSSK